MRLSENGSACAPVIYSVTALQEVLLASSTDSLQAGARNVRLICTLRGAINPDLARAAFDRLVERHEMLRTFYARDVSGAWQCGAGESRCDFEAPGRSELAAAPFEDYVNRETDRSFDLENGPLLRVRLYKGAANTASLLLCAPFIAADLASLRILMSEFESVYGALRSGSGFRLSAPRVNYFDYVQQSRAQSRSRRARPAWGPTADSLPVLDLPFDHSDAASVSDSQGEVLFEVPPSLAQRIESLTFGSESAQAGLFLATFAILLSRYSLSERIPVALPVSDRKADTRKAVGNYSRFDAAVVECKRQSRFREMFEKVTLTGALASDAEEIPCSAWYGWENGRALRLCKSTSFESVETGCLPVPGLFPLGLRISEGAESIRGSLVYRRDRFLGTTVERMARQFLQLLGSICDRPDSLIAELEMLPDEERQQVLACAAGPREEFPAACLHELFAQQVARRPEAEAIVFGADRLTYAEVDRRSNQVAQFLRANGLRPLEIVGVCMEPSADWVVALVGVLKAGGAYAPIDPKFPPERIAFMINDMMARWVIVRDPAPVETRATATLVSMSGPESGIARASSEPVPNASTPDAAAVLIYTSGTTGQPKGTLIPHRSVIRVVQERHFVQITQEDRVAQVMSPSFDVCILEVWAAFTNGAALIGISEYELQTPRAMARILQAERITFLAVPAAYLSQIGREDPGMLRNLRTVIYGGEPADPAAIRSILKAGPPENLVNAYGPTEGCIAASCYRIERIEEKASSIPIGRSLANVTLYLLDGNLRPVPFGVPGEICIGGDIGLGYWRRPELTRQKFIPDFMSGREGATLYRTGDMARLRADGNLDFLGRADEQITVRGVRIQLTAIQIALSSHPDVSEAIVVVRENEAGSRRLMAYVKLRRELEHAAQVLRRYAQSRVPEYLVPAVIVIVESIPLNANGKVNRAAFAAPREWQRIPAGRQSPRTELQQAVATLWRELLMVETVGLNDNFFDLGGDSLLGMRLAVSLHESLGIGVALQALFSSATLREFCAALEADEITPGRIERVAGILNRMDALSPLELEEAIRSLDRA
ncbi:MAG TPA: amino acid adenylation domain-containing protein [Bryobacteraceae bacterium]